MHHGARRAHVDERHVSGDACRRASVRRRWPAPAFRRAMSARQVIARWHRGSTQRRSRRRAMSRQIDGDDRVPLAQMRDLTRANRRACRRANAAERSPAPVPISYRRARPAPRHRPSSAGRISDALIIFSSRRRDSPWPDRRARASWSWPNKVSSSSVKPSVASPSSLMFAGRRLARERASLPMPLSTAVLPCAADRAARR